jgi:murein DD-endopeptidase MepM/ murein hydrolase activator NlpD
MGAACSGDATRIREPFFTGSTPNQRDIIGSASQPMPPPLPAGAVASSALPPPAGVVASSGPIGGTGAWSAAGGSVVTVGPGESLDTLAIKYGVPSVEIARANGISNPADLKPGRAIVIPRRAAAYAPPPVATTEPTRVSAPAPVAAAAPVKRGDVIHVVEPGQTLYSIARTQGVRVADIMAVNGLSTETIRVGQRLRMPAGSGAVPAETVALRAPAPSPTLGAPPKPLGTLSVKADGTPTAAAPVAATPAAPAAVAAVPPVPDVPAIPKAPEAAPAPTVTAAAKAVDDATDPPSANGTSFRWPVRGRIISGFGAKPNGERNEGINLAVPEGTSVKAVEAGTVIYAGNELAGYGNLVLIRHADGWVSAYAHNSQITVKRGDKVGRGQTIAQAGMTGSVTAPQVHFELRKGTKPVNPLDYLAGT